MFAPARCLFGSNFPIEKLWTRYSDLVAAYRCALEPFGEAAARRERSVSPLCACRPACSRDVLITIIKSNGRRVSVHWFVGVLQSLCSPS